MKFSSVLTLATASFCSISLAAPVSNEAIRERSHANPLSDPSTVSVNPTAEEVSEDLDFGSEPGNEIGPTSRRKRFVPATMLETRTKAHASINDLIDFASEPGNEILGSDSSSDFSSSGSTLKDRDAAPQPQAAKSERLTERSQSVGAQTVDDNSLFEGWGFADGPSDPISANPDLRDDDGLGDSSIS